MLWDMRTGALTGSTAEVLSVSRGGHVLQYALNGPTPGRDRSGNLAGPLPAFCPKVADLAEMPTGFCSDDYTLRQFGIVSPDGAWVALSVDRGEPRTTTIYVLRTEDLRSGRWRAVTAALSGAANLGFWVTGETFVAGRRMTGTPTGATADATCRDAVAG
jgi:hypothetical protein